MNNAVYLNYLQHARHEYGLAVGFDWLKMSARGIDLVLRRVEIDYRQSLRPGDRIEISVQPARKGKFRLYFHQDILLLPERIPAAHALITIACVIDGKPAAPPEIDKWFGPYR